MTKIEQLRIKKGVTIYAMAKHFGTSIPAMTYKIEKKDYSREHNELKKLAEYFGCEIEDIVD